MAWVLLAATAAVAARGYWRLLRILRFLDWRQQLQHGARPGPVGGARHPGAPAPDRDAHAHAPAGWHPARLPAGGDRDARRRAGARSPRRSLVWFNKSARRLLGLQYPQGLDQPLPRLWPAPGLAQWLRGEQGEASFELPSPVDDSQLLSLRC
jgi:two-component system phosphate regulon sensor histidine kinase PhoR